MADSVVQLTDMGAVMADDEPMRAVANQTVSQTSRGNADIVRADIEHSGVSADRALL